MANKPVDIRMDSAVFIRASMKNLISSLTPSAEKMTAPQLEAYMREPVLKSFKEVVRKWRSYLTRKGIDSSYRKGNGEEHIYNALVSGEVDVIPAGAFRKIIQWEVLSSVKHMEFTFNGFGPITTSSPEKWGRMASVADWANNKLGWDIPISNGLVDRDKAKNEKMIFAGRETTKLSAIIILLRSVDDTALKSYKLAEHLQDYVVTAIFSSKGLQHEYLRLYTDYLYRKPSAIARL